jgi:undecaprenyl-diphosphatase
MENTHILLALFTGFVQGIIEWLPVSSKTMNLLILSSGGIPVNQAYALGLIANFGSFFAALVYFKNDILQMLTALRHPFSQKPAAQLLRFMILGTLATGVVGVPLYKLAQQTLSLASGSVAMLIVGGLLLLTGFIASRREKLSATQSQAEEKEIPNAWRSLSIGGCQGFAALPGISRSGVTVTPLLTMGYSAKESIRLSFLLNVIALLGAGAVPLLADKEGFSAIQELGIASTIIMLLVAAITSFFTIGTVLQLAQRLKTSVITYFIAGITLSAALVGLIASM